MDCPTTSYDRLSETYAGNFQWRVPFSPAALSHIELLLVRASVLLNLTDDPNNDFTLLRPGVFSKNVTVKVRLI